MNSWYLQAMTSKVGTEELIGVLTALKEENSEDKKKIENTIKQRWYTRIIDENKDILQFEWHISLSMLRVYYKHFKKK